MGQNVPPNVPLPTCNLFGEVDFEKRDNDFEWHVPAKGINKGLRVKNSLTAHGNSNRLDPFVPGYGNRVLWYTCGPTVYAPSHLGHARAYLTFDILRRITEDYFGYDVLYHVNVTDIDDKIILNARKNKLYDLYCESNPSFDDAKKYIQAGLDMMEAKIIATEEEVAKPLPEDATIKAKQEYQEKKGVIGVKRSQFTQLSKKINAVASGDVAALLQAGKDPLREQLDLEKSETITDQAVFDAHARKYEKEFFEDMDTLGVRPPDVVTRVTEYVPHIVEFIQKIVDKGLAYESAGSVYLSIDDFKKAGHTYRKLEPGKETTEAEMAEGEGALAAGEAQEKRNKNDFALWKARKKGEPSWDSPWGPGRPGWHIECSVIASDLLGNCMDIHAGGQDLKFPHHDNELAQSESHFGHCQWVNYFFHAGHLDIDGLKMAKSLKNFVTIRELFDDPTITPRTIRLMFLMQSWHKKMNYSTQTIESAKGKEKSFREFFHKIKSYQRSDWAEKPVGVNSSAGSRDMIHLLFETQTKVDEAFKNNFDTVTAMLALENLVTEFNKYEKETEIVAVHVAMKVGFYLTKIFRILGLSSFADEIGFGQTGEGASREETLRPVLDEFVQFRKDIRISIKNVDDSELKEAILKISDSVRDSLPKIGVAFDDVGGDTVWKVDDPKVLLADLAKKKEAQQKAELKKLQGGLAKYEKDLKKLRAVHGVGEPSQMFKSRFPEYTFDEEGMPTADEKKEPLAKSALKKLQKEKSQQQTDWEKLNKEHNNDLAGAISKLEGQIAESEKKINLILPAQE